MRLVGGPAHGADIHPGRDMWVWVSVQDGELLVYDLDRPEAGQFPHRKTTGQWDEYVPDVHDPSILRYARRTP